MIKTFLITLSFSIFLHASQQIILVVAEDFQTPKAQMICYENGKKIFEKIAVNLGKNGLGWGLGIHMLEQKKAEPLKYEGDKKAPAGIFKLGTGFGYARNKKLKIPYTFTSENLICVDDSNSDLYNKIIFMPKKNKPISFETMKRKDDQYKLGVEVLHNFTATPQRGSCIFLHVEKGKDVGTAGCTSMKYEKLSDIVEWLDQEKNPILIQIPKRSAQEVIKLYPELKNSELLH